MLVRAVLLFFLSFIGGASVHAVSLLNDSFSYTNGSLVTVSSGKWNTHSGTTTGQVEVVSGRVFLSQSETEDVNALLATNAASTFYASLKINLTNLPTSGISYFAHFKDAGTANFRAKIFATTNGAATGFFRIAIANVLSTSVSASLPTDFSPNTDYTIVVRYNNSTATTTLWLNPSAETDASVTASDSASAISVMAFAFRQSTSVGNLFVDDLLIGTSFADIISGAPPGISTQPESQTVTEGSTAAFTVAASGTSLSYQWKFYGTNLANATNATLTLPIVTTNQSGPYIVTVSNAFGSTNSNPATLTVTPLSVGALSVFNYNTHGNSVEDWSTNSAQVRAIGRQVAYLKPDVVTFQEIPTTNRWQMTNFVKAFLPGYNLATNSGTDGFICSVIASRFPITRSQKWLDGANLDSFGYTNSNFTRDLFEVQISVPNFEQPVHVFTTHLKSGNSSSDDAAKRAAEASAISNYFVTGFLTTNRNRLFVLTGDMNEDIARPSTGSQQPIQRLVNTATDLRLTTPTTPSTGDERTFSVQNLSKRYDYILPCSLLFSNINRMQIFRTDVLSPTPTNVLSSDSVTASDHLPLLMVFNNPYNTPFQIRSLTLSDQQLALNWQSGSNRQYRVESSTNLTNWTALSGNILASGTNTVFTTNVSGAEKFFRVYRTP